MTKVKTRSGLLAVSLAAALGAGPGVAAETAGAAASQPKMVGADRDEHGCIGSAGYLWCEREGACVRPWELADAKGFELSDEAFAEYCAPPGSESSMKN
jgi:hypothetical protein